MNKFIEMEGKMETYCELKVLNVCVPRRKINKLPIWFERETRDLIIRIQGRMNNLNDIELI